MFEEVTAGPFAGPADETAAATGIISSRVGQRRPGGRPDNNGGPVGKDGSGGQRLEGVLARTTGPVGGAGPPHVPMATGGRPPQPARPPGGGSACWTHATSAL